MAEITLEYCIDSSALIDLKDSYPMETFPAVWNKIDSIIKIGRLYAPLEVSKEIHKGDDELVHWVKKRPLMFAKPDKEQVELLKQMLTEHPAFLDWHKAVDADPWVIILARSRLIETSLFKKKIFVVSHERIVQGKTKIPNVCRYYKVPCISALQMFQEEGWSFK